MQFCWQERSTVPTGGRTGTISDCVFAQVGAVMTPPLKARKTVLVAADFYGSSDLALRRGIAVAAELDADVRLISIVNAAIPDEFASVLIEKTRRHLCEAALELGKGVKSQIMVETGDPVERSLELINSQEIDLVVVGQHHKRGILDGLTKPTVFWNIVSRSESPVLLVAKPVCGMYRRVLVPVAFSSACHRALGAAQRLAPGAEFRVFHARAVPNPRAESTAVDTYSYAIHEDAKCKLREWACDLPSGLPDIDLVDDGVAVGVQRMIDDFQPDLLAVGARKCDVSRTGLGSYASGLLRDPSTDILICR